MNVRPKRSLMFKLSCVFIELSLLLWSRASLMLQKQIVWSTLTKMCASSFMFSKMTSGGLSFLVLELNNNALDAFSSSFEAFVKLVRILGNHPISAILDTHPTGVKEYKQGD